MEQTQPSSNEKDNLSKIRLLLIEDNPGDVRLIREALKEGSRTEFELECTDLLSKGLERLSKGGIDAVLLDLSLPDSLGADTFFKVQAQARELPIVVLTGLEDETTAMKTVKDGAQDYLFKGRLDGQLLERSLRYAIERQRMLAEFRLLSLSDELTGLYNRRGFLMLAQQQMKSIERTKKGMLLFFIDLDDLKLINDHLGHSAGDTALQIAAKILKKTFRKSDIVGRVGGDEFAVLAIEATKKSTAVLNRRLQAHLESYNNKMGRDFNLSLSVGVTHCQPSLPCSISELLSDADNLMYAQKKKKKHRKKGKEPSIFKDIEFSPPAHRIISESTKRM